MSILAAACCCKKLWYAVVCPEYFANYCCEPGCEGAVSRIEFCEEYLAAMGIPVPPDPNKCYYISYDCCIYVLTGFEDVVCPNPSSPYPVNQGTLVKVKDKLPPPAPNACCYPQPVEHDPVGGIGDIVVNEEPVISEPSPPCEEMIAECYNFYDQAGTVKGKEVTVSSTVTMCVNQFGIPWDTRCDHGPPQTIVPVTKTLTEKIGQCICCETTNGECTDYGPCMFACPNERRQIWREYLSCADDPNCIPDADCCGQTSPCETDPDFCNSTFDPLETYQVSTCYSLNTCNDDHVEDILKLVFPCCFATNRGVDCDDQEGITSLFVNNIVDITAETVNTGWGVFTNIPAVNVCGLKVVCFSGNAGHIAERINYRIGGLVSASGIAPWSAFFWFGFRQSCFNCPNVDPNTRPPWSFGDTIYVDRAVYNPANQTVEVYLKAVSPRWYLCTSQGAKAWYDCRDEYVRNAAISAVGDSVPYALHCLSFPEYSSGARYSMRRVEELASEPTTICTDINYYVFAPSCLAVNGFPLDDVYIYPPSLPPILVQQGWRTLCPQMYDPRTKCRCYPFTYEVAPCCPPDTDCEQWAIDHPLPAPCVHSFQSPSVYCETNGSTISVT